MRNVLITQLNRDSIVKDRRLNFLVTTSECVAFLTLLKSRVFWNT